MILRRKIMIITAIIFSVFVVTSCAEKNNYSDEKLKVVTTIFPQYDFARIIGGEKVQVIKLLPDGSESHTYDPSIKDITQVTSADIFIYTGKEMEAWAYELIQNSDTEELIVVDLSDGITLIEGVKGNEGAIDQHNEHFHDYDAHIWTSPENAIIMADKICDVLCKKDSGNADYYMGNAAMLKQELGSLSKMLRSISEKSDGRTLYFGGRFAFRYMFEEYNLKYRSVYSGCAEESEPSIKTISAMISEMKANKVKYIFYEEMSEGKIAKSIAEETGASLLLLHSCHNISASQENNGENYISIMKENIKNIEKALGIS